MAALFDPAAREVAARERSTVADFRARAPGAAHILVATHATVTPHRTFSTSLLFVSGDSDDGRLRAGDVASMTLARAELVTLAACDTAAGAPLLSDERLDLARAFLAAGASAVLGTRWKIPDSEKTTRFLVDFYRAMRERKQTKAAALREARAAARERKDPAQVWAAFMLVGDPR